MKVLFALIAALLGFTTLPALAQSGRTFYIDYASGSNSNPGTKSAPWKTHPYMQTGAACSGSGSNPSYAHQAGDHFVFKGGVTWPVACFALYVTSGGTGSAQDYYGVDKSWFAGSSWARPLWDMNYQAPAGNNVFAVIYTADYITIDDIEIAHQQIVGKCGGSCTSGGTGGNSQQAAVSFINGGSYPVNKIAQNLYIHDWVTLQTGPCLGFLEYAAGGIYGASLVDGVEISGENSWYGPSHTPLWFGGGAVTGYQGGGGNFTVRNSKIHGGMNACFAARFCYNNEIYHESSEHAAIDNCPHSQVVENDDGGVDVVYNNYIHDNVGRNGQNVGVVVYEGPNSVIFNNIMSNNNAPGYNGDIVISEGNSGPQPSAVASIYNNTVDCSNGVACFATDTKNPLTGSVNLKNNIFITSGASISTPSSIAKFSNTNNYVMSTSEAKTFGFTSDRNYMPTSSNSHVVGQGVNLGSLASGVLGALASDAAGAPWYGASFNARTSPWDLGALVVGSQSGSNPTPSKPNPPTGLAATAQ